MVTILFSFGRSSDCWDKPFPLVKSEKSNSFYWNVSYQHSFTGLKQPNMCIVRAYVCVKFVSWTEWKRAIVIRVKYKKQKIDTKFVVDAIGHTQYTVQCTLNIRFTRTTKLTTKPLNDGAEFYNSTHSLSCYILASRCGEENSLAFAGYTYWYKRESQKRNNFARHSRLGFCLFCLVVSGALLISMAHTQ